MNNENQSLEAKWPHLHILMMGGGGGSEWFFWVRKILAKSDFFGSMKDAGIFLGREKKQRDLFLLWKMSKGFFGVC